MGVVSGIVIAALYAAATVFMWQAPMPATDRSTRFSVHLDEDGQNITRDVNDPAVIDSLVTYFNTPGVERGYWDINSFCADLEIQCEGAHFNFVDGRVIIATWAKPHDPWSQRSRSKTATDERLETVVRTWLARGASVPAK